MWSWLRDRRFTSHKFRRQCPLGDYVLDFFCLEARLDIELDGSQHGLPFQQGLDAQRDAWLEQRGVKVLRFWNGRLRREKQLVRDTIWRTLQERAPRQLPDYWKPGLSKGYKTTADQN
jgi:very-short-patch-repair endonuclease